MLKIKLLNTRDSSADILLEDLTSIDTDHTEVKPYHQELFRLCKEKHGVGVSANQVGLRKNFFFVTPGAQFPNKNGGRKHVAHLCINPTWKPEKGAILVDGVEGCLSIPGREFVVQRYGAIRAKWTNAMGHSVEMKLKGKAARVFQHEHDHLRGVVLFESGKEVK